jgi:hypothetical protein
MKQLNITIFLAALISLLGSWTCGSTDKISTPVPAKTADQSLLIDTAKLKSDLSDVLNSMSSGKPDTAKLKKAASDILTTDATVLSDSGIDAMGGGNSNDPAVNSARAALKKMRDGMGLTPDKLDSIRKAAAQLGKN